MADLNKVIAGLECCADLDRSCESCPYEGAEYCEVALMKDTLELLQRIPRTCQTCVHEDADWYSEPCKSCWSSNIKLVTGWRWEYGND